MGRFGISVAGQIKLCDLFLRHAQKVEGRVFIGSFADSIPIGISKAQTLTKLPEFSEMSQSEQEKAGVGALNMVMTEWNILRSNFQFVDDEFAKLGEGEKKYRDVISCLLYTSPSPRDLSTSRMPSSA